MTTVAEIPFSKADVTGRVVIELRPDGWYAVRELIDGRPAPEGAAMYRRFEDARGYAEDMVGWRERNGAAEPEGLWGGYARKAGPRRTA